MTDIDKAREIARIIKNAPPNITLSPENAKILANGFLALDEQATDLAEQVKLLRLLLGDDSQ